MGRSRKLQDIKSLEFKRNLIKNLRNLKTFFNEARRRHLNTFSKTNKHYIKAALELAETLKY